MNIRLIQFGVYMVAGACFASDMFVSLAMWFWGARLHPLLYVGFIASIALMVAGIISLSRPDRSRIIAVFGVVGIGAVMIPRIAYLIPRHNIIISPVNHFALVGYLGLLAFTLFFPQRLRFGIAAFIAICFVGAALGAITYTKRVEAGEYARPGTACFRWYSKPKDDLVITRDPFQLINDETRAALGHAGIQGTIEWTSGSWYNSAAASRLLVLARSKPLVDSKLYPAKSGLLIYAFDGERWIKYPKDAQTYSLFLTLETEGSTTMIYQNVGDGKQGFQAFSWYPY